MLVQLLEPLVTGLRRRPYAQKFALVGWPICGLLLILACGLAVRGELPGAALACGLALLAGGLIYALHLAISGAVSDLARMTGAVVEGTYRGDLTAGEDELGRVARSFSQVAADLKQTADLQRAVLEHAFDGILVTDEHDCITTYNPAAERIFGYPPAEIIGRPIAQLIPDPAHRVYRLISAGSEVTGRRRDGGSFPMDLTSGQLVLDNQRLYVLIVRDVTRRKQQEAELLRAKEAAEASSRAKSTFLANMGHELRTPLNAVIGYSEMLLEDARDNGADGSVEDLERINDAGRHLLRLISDILDISKIEAGRMELQIEHVALAPLLNELLTSMLPLAAANGNRLTLEAAGLPEVIETDGPKLRRILFNLLSNACKFTNNGQVTLRVERIENEEVRSEKKDFSLLNAQFFIRFAVIDTGIGIAPEQLERLFEPFTQADESSTRRYGGSGLGLAIAQRFCLLLGGVLEVTSRPGEGSTFQLNLPVALLKEEVGRPTRNVEALKRGMV